MEFTPNENGSITLKLQYPIQVSGEEVNELTFQRLKARHIKMLSTEPSTTDVLNIASKVCGITPKEFDEIDGADALKIIEVVTSFLGAGLETGKTL